MPDWLEGSFVFILMLLVMALVVRFIYWLTIEEIKDLGRLESDPDFRAETLKQLEQSLAARPDDPRLLRRRADLLRFDEDWAGVCRDLQAYLAKKPDDDVAWQELAEAEYLRGRPAEAESAIERAVALDPAYVDYYILQAAVLLKNRRFAAARAAVDRWEQASRARYEQRQGGRSIKRYLSHAAPPPDPAHDPQPVLYRAAIAQAEGRDAVAGDLVADALRLDRDRAEEAVDADPLLQPLRALLPDNG